MTKKAQDKQTLNAPSSASNANPMWGGHYAAGPAEAFAAINPSIDVDQRLYAYDIQGSIAHCQMLEACEILSKDESQQIQDGLAQVKEEIESGEFVFKPELEDIHMNIEARLKDLIGDVAGKLHTARSRNDQVATDFRLWVRDAYGELEGELKALQSALITKAQAHTDTIMPGFTHLQSAQPVTLAHHFMAYTEMFQRDTRRVGGFRRLMNLSCPLGAAALAGTSFPIDRTMTSDALGFHAPANNSLDAVSDRDFAMDAAYVCSTILLHLSRLAEELILWVTPQFGFVTLPEAFTSGSSIMPQKRNPDAAELIRGKSGRVIGNLNQLLTMMKGLPLAYNKDTQEDKESLFDSVDTTLLCLKAMRGMIEGMEANTQAMRAAAESGFSTATDLADWLVRTLNIPFREAHHVTGAVVALAETQGCRLDELSLEAMQSVHAGITKEVFSVLSVEASVASRTSFGGTAPARVSEAIAKAKEEYL